MNTPTIIIIITFIAFIIWIVKYLEKNLPKRDSRIKKEWEAEIKRKQIKLEHEKKEDLKILQVVNEEKRKKTYKDNIRKGRDYELYISDYFRKQGYKIKPFGILNGRKDKGIDVIIMKDKEITLIQCKNWKANSNYKVKHQHLKEFLGNTTAFLENNKDRAEGYTIKRLYVTSNDVLDNSAKYFLRNNKIIIIPQENNTRKINF